MKIWTSEHVFSHSWDTICRGQWQKYPNPHNNAVIGTDVVERSVDESGVLHSHRIISSDWGLAPWVQSLIGTNRTCYAYEYSVVDPRQQLMEMKSVNLTFCNFVSMTERMSYRPHPEDPENRTLMKQETVVTVRGVPLTSYMEGIILNTVSANAGKGRQAINWIVEKLGAETKNLSASLDVLRTDLADLKHTVEERIIATARKSIDEIQRDLGKIQPPVLQAQEATATASASAAASKKSL